jgi:hypothetical protein
MIGNSSSQPPQAQPFGVQDQMTANQQQALPGAYVAGTRKLVIKWVGPIYNLRSAPAPQRTGKK